MDLRQRIADALRSGQTYRHVAKRFSVGTTTVERIAKRVRLGQSLAPKPTGGSVGRITAADRDMLLGWLEAEPDLTQQRIADRLTAMGRPVSQPAVSRGLRRLGITRKKRASGTRSS